MPKRKTKRSRDDESSSDSDSENDSENDSEDEKKGGLLQTIKNNKGKVALGVAVSVGAIIAGEEIYSHIEGSGIDYSDIDEHGHNHIDDNDVDDILHNDDYNCFIMYSIPH
tara:strand:- start:4960 stop:5292 length:333 start_codon:yes stop_codon:yes gene_type:complete